MAVERSLVAGFVPPPVPHPRAAGPAARLRMASQTFASERRALAATARQRMSRALVAASAGLAVLFLALLVAIPVTRRAVVRVELPAPPRTVTLEPTVAVEPPPLTAPEQPLLEQVRVRTVADPPRAAALPPARLPEREPAADPRALEAGRARARAATAALATAALDRSLGGLSDALDGARADGTPQPAARDRRVRGGRAAGELAAVAAGTAGGAARADLAGSTVRGGAVELGAPQAAPEPADDAPPTAAPPGVHRSNASLLAVIQRYAAGIHHCYATELKRDPRLRGKLVVAITVAPGGQVTEAAVVEDTAGAPRLTACALTQIRDWRFPPIARGMTTFQAPFVFTPPE